MSFAGGDKVKVTRFACGSDEVLICPSEDTPLGIQEAEEGLAEDLDLPALPSFKSNDRLFRRRNPRALALAGAASLLCLAGLAGLLLRQGAEAASASDSTELWRRCDYAQGFGCPAPSLLEMSEVHIRATENILRVAGLGAEHTASVRGAVAETFRNVSQTLERHARQAVQELETVRISLAQRDAILNSLRLLADPRIEAIGLDVAEAVGRAAQEGRNASSALARVLGGLELGNLDLHMAKLLWSEGRQWDLSTEAEHLKSMAKVSHRWHGMLEGGAAVQVQERAVVAAALVQARALLGIVKARVRSALPAWITSESSYLGIQGEHVSCDLEEEQAALNRIACPLKFGIEGMDALRAYYSEQRSPRREEVLPRPGAPGAGKELMVPR